MTKSYCETCIFYMKTDIKQGECRRFPPSSDMGGVWPRVTISGWCGEHTDAPVVEVKPTQPVKTVDEMGIHIPQPKVKTPTPEELHEDLAQTVKKLKKKDLQTV